MRKGFLTTTLAVVLICAAPAIRADVWDVGADNDNDFGSDNELVHGLQQVHDLAAQAGGTIQDVDWYRFNWPGSSSFEVVMDGLTGDVSNGTTQPVLEMMGEDGTTNQGVSLPITGFGVARSLRGTSGLVIQEVVRYVRVSGASCGLGCTANDQYRIRFYDTTAAVPRFNNANGQVTVFVLQNTTQEPVSGYVVALGPDGSFLDSFNFDLAPLQVSTFNLATVGTGYLNGKSGALRIVNDAPYGRLAGKAVALEPSTGFTFDTPMVYRPH
jgi:hypothetical protein